MAKRKITKQDREWSKAVREIWGNKCAVCGSELKINAHHLIPREISKFKYSLWNGIALCPSHHRFNFYLSAHQNPISFLMWLDDFHPNILKKVKEKIKNN